MLDFISRLTIISFIFFTNPVIAKCNFKTSDQIDNLTNLNNIKKIEIEVQNNRKWTKNAFDIIKDDNSTIQIKNKKKFDSNIKIIFNFGFCNYYGKIRVSGDKKDHLDLDNGNLKASLDVELKKGNINSSTKFKLFLPKTRKGNNEIFTTLLLKKLGFIAPETFYVDIKLNELEYKALFQEKSVKELLEKNLRVEGPIFEGDEEILWQNQKNMKFASMNLEKLSGSRLTNKKWASKNVNTAIISLNSFVNLQKAYFNYSLEDASYYIDPNLNKNNIFALYDLTLMAMNGFHGLRPHNRKYYYNTQTQIFEPIYYDGETYYEENLLRDNIKENLNFNDTFLYSEAFKEENINQTLDKINMMNIDELIKDYKILSKLGSSEAKKEVKSNIKIIKQNLDVLKNFFKDFKKLDHRQKIVNKDWFNQVKKFEGKYKFNQEYIFIEHINFEDQKISIYCRSKKNCSKSTIDFNDLIYLMEENKYKGSRALIYDANIDILKDNFKVTKNIFNNHEIISSLSADIRFNEKDKTINLVQKYSDDWFLIKDQKIGNIKFNFDGIKNNKKNKYQFEGLGKNGLTGCLTFYNVDLKEVDFMSKNGECEDSINFILTTGKINNIIVENAYSDGVDFDFSKLTIDEIKVNKSLNDCLDFSFGKYIIKKIDVYKCEDKGVSVGENSNLKVNDVYINDANIGVASKDSSKVFLTNTNINLVQTCLTANNKKQEFNGAILETGYLNCKNYDKKIDMGDDSSILVLKN